MKKLLTAITLAVFATALFAAKAPENFFADAKTKAAAEHKAIFVVFSGLEWCGPCKMFNSKVITSKEFKAFAKKNLVFIEVDTKANGNIAVSIDNQKLKVNTSSAQKFNAAVAEFKNKYHLSKGVPFSILLDAEGKILTQQRGFNPKVSPKDFVDKLKKAKGK